MDGYFLIVKYSLTLFERLLDQFCGNAHISFEGDLSQCDLRGISLVNREPTGVLKRNTLQPKLDFIILPIDEDTIQTLKRQILPRIGIHKRVIHAQIEKDGKLVFGAYDNLHPDCVWISKDVPDQFLQELVDSNSIKEYSPSHNLNRADG